MNTVERICDLVAKGEWVISQHAATRIRELDLLPSELTASLKTAVVVEDYVEAKRGPSVLLMQSAPSCGTIHVVWAFHLIN